MSTNIQARRAAGPMAGIIAAGLLAMLARAGEQGRAAVKVTIEDEKAVIVETAPSVDPTPQIRFTPNALGAQIRDQGNRQLHLSQITVLNLDGQVTQAGQGGKFEKLHQPLPRTVGGKLRPGYMSVYRLNDLRITMTAELVATKPSARDAKRELGSVLMRYTVENLGAQPRKFGLKSYFDIYVISNDGALFAAPTFPNKILDGIELKDKTLPAYVQCLERPDLKNPGYVAHLTLDLGSSLEKATRVVLSRHGAGGFNNWEMPAIQAMGDSALAVFFDPKEIKPGGKREFGYAYGKGVAVAPESEGRVAVHLGGSFEPGKLFTVTAQVHDPVAGQALILELPKGMSLVEGREIQPVPLPFAEPPQSLVVWKCRVDELGRFPVRLRSSTGMTQTKIITIRAGE
jgi:hypothetical protein